MVRKNPLALQEFDSRPPFPLLDVAANAGLGLDAVHSIRSGNSARFATFSFLPGSSTDGYVCIRDTDKYVLAIPSSILEY